MLRNVVPAVAVAGILALSAAAQPVPKVRQGLAVEYLGSPVKARSLSNECVHKSAATGELHLTLYLQAFTGMHADPPFQIYDLNLDTGQARIVDGMVGRPGPQCTLFHSNGKLYMGTSRPCDVLEYDFATGKARRLGSLSDNYYHGVQTAAEGPDGAVYFGTMGYIAGRYDPKTDKLESFGVMGGENWGSYGYVYTLASDGRYVYCGIGQMPWYLVVYDIQARTQKVYFRPARGEPNPYGGVVESEDGQIYYSVGGTTYLLKDGEPVKLDKRPAIKPKRHGRLYEMSEVEKALGMEIDTSGIRPTNWNNGQVTVRWRKTGEADWRASTTHGVDVSPNVPKCLAALPDGKLLGFGAFYGPFFLFDPETKSSSYLGPSPGSIYDILVAGDKAYLSGYSSLFCVYDTAKPWTLSEKNPMYSREQNPCRVSLQPTGKYNYFLALGADGRIYSGQHHERGSVGGSFGWYDPKTGKSGGHREELVKHDVRDIVAVNEGRTIVVSTIGIEQGLKGRLFVYDTESQKIAAVHEPLPELRETGKLLDGGPDLVLGLVRVPGAGGGKESGLLYKVNVKSGEVLFKKTVPGRVFNGASGTDMLMSDARFTRGPDGCGWLYIDDDLCRIHPEDGQVEKVLKTPARGKLLFLGKDLYIYNGGREYFGGFSQILRVRNVLE